MSLLLLLLLQLRQAGGIFRAGARGGALRAPQGRPRQGRTGQGRRVVLHLGLALRRRHRREVPRPRAGGLERALRRASRLALAEFGTFPGEKEVRVPPRRFGRLHFKSVVVVKLERRPGILAGKLNESPVNQLTSLEALPFSLFESLRMRPVKRDCGDSCPGCRTFFRFLCSLESSIIVTLSKGVP